MRKRAKPIMPIATFDEAGKLIWNKEITDKIKKLGKAQKAARRQPGGRLA